MRRLRVDWPEAWYPVAAGALWVRPVDVLAVAPGDGATPAERLAAGRLPRAEAHGAAWRALLRFGLRKPAGALLGEAVGREGVARASRLGAQPDGEAWAWPDDDLGAWLAGGARLDRLWPAVDPAADPLRGGALRAFAEGLRGPRGEALPPALAARLAADAAAGLAAKGPGPAARAEHARAGWGVPC